MSETSDSIVQAPYWTHRPMFKNLFLFLRQVLPQTQQLSIALCCSLLLSVALCCSLLLSVALCCPLLLSVALCCSLLLSFALCCSLLLSVALCCPYVENSWRRFLLLFKPLFLEPSTELYQKPTILTIV